MSDTFTMSTGQAHELALAFARNGWNNEQVKRLSEGDLLANVRRVVEGYAAITMMEHVIDLDADPHNPYGNDWTVEEHLKGGQWKFDPKQVELYLNSEQRKEKYVVGTELRKELVGKPTLNANALDYLLAHPHLIPEEWKKDEKGRTRYIFFWGTVYRNRDGSLCVRYLCWSDGGWYWSRRRLGNGWYVFDPAALRAS